MMAETSRISLREENKIRFSEVVSALSYALDITEGQPTGHAARSCIIGMRLAKAVGLERDLQTALFYGLLLKDLGCSSNASRVCTLFGSDDRQLKCDLKTTNWTQIFDSVRYVFRNVALGGSILKKASRFAAVASSGPTLAKELVRTRCERGEKIARQLQLPDATAKAIHCLDEHWDGSGYPNGRAGEEIPMLARIMGLAQTAEVFWHRADLAAACDMAAHRRGTWFDPQLVDAFLGMRNDPKFLASIQSQDVAAEAAALEPEEWALPADDDMLERLAVGFSEVVDAKSPWTYEHSRGVAVVAEGIGHLVGLRGRDLRMLRWAALLHDVGKLGVSNLILDKPGQLNADEMAKMRRHTAFTHEILRRVRGFSEFADMAAGHHERLDGRGYHLGLSGEAVTLEMRILSVADMYEALAAKRPYRPERTKEEALTIMDREIGKGLCPMAVSALKTFLKQSRFVPYQVAA